MPDLGYTYGDLLEGVGFAAGMRQDRTRWAPDELKLVDRMVQMGYRQMLYPPIVPGRSRAHRWGWLFPTTTLELLAAVTGTLDRVLDPIGAQYILIANEEVFTSAMEGLIVKMDDSGMRYTIVDYLTASKVKMQGEEGTETEYGGIKKSKIVSAAIVGTMTLITSTDGLFTVDMVGDEWLEDSTFGTYTIKRFVSTTEVYLDGDASGEPGSVGQIIRTSAFTSVPTLSGNRQTVIANSPPPFNSNMVDPGSSTRRVQLSKGGPSGAVIKTFTDSSTIVVDDQLGLTASAIGDSFYVSITSSVITYGSALNVMTVVVQDPIFTEDDVDRYLSVEGTSQRGLKILNYIDPYTVQGVIAVDTISPIGDFAEGVGHVTYEPLEITAMFYNATLKKTFVTVSSATVLSTADAGRAVYSPVTEKTYSITAYDSATTLWVSGNMTEELPAAIAKPWNHWIVGPVTHAADDAFTVLNTGGDYEMPNDFPGTMDGYFTFDPTQGFAPIQVVGEGQIRKLRQGSTATGKPLYAAFVPIRSDNTRPQRFLVMFWPAAEQSYTLSYRYAVSPQKLSDANPYPLGGPEHAGLLMESCLAMVETHIEDATGTSHREAFIRMLATSITIDEEAITPQFLGYNANEEQRIVSQAEWRRLNATQVTIDGVLY